MITIESKLNISGVYPINEPYSLEDIVFFDIETTGFSAKTSFLYLIGCMYYKDENWQLTQWLADDMNSEAAILKSFFTVLKNCKKLVHYNGSGFDIPFIIQKCKQHTIPEPFSTIESFDIYKKILPYKRLLPLRNYKLKTIEDFMGIHRKDTCSGEELIPIYANYLGKVQYEKLHNRSNNQDHPDNTARMFNPKELSSSEEFSQTLLLHNLEDVTSLLEISTILYFIDLFESKLELSDISPISCGENSCEVKIQLPITFPISVLWEVPLAENFLKMKVTNNQLNLYIPIYHGELKYFYTNYKDYYFLPKENVAMHASVAQYVDKEYRVKAKPSTCYTRQVGSFLPQMESSLSPYFKLEYKDKITYIELTNPILKDEIILCEYIKNLCCYFVKNKETKPFLI